MFCCTSDNVKEPVKSEVEKFSCTAQGTGILGNTHVQITDSAWKFIIDEPEEDGGKNQNGNPMHHFVASLAGCENEQAAVVAGEMGIKIESISFEIDVDLDLAAFGGDNLKLKQPFQQAVIQAVVTTDATDAQVTALGDAIAARCPIRRLLVNSGATMKSTYAKAGGAAVTAVTAGAAPAEPVERFSCTAVGSGIMGDTQVQITGASWKFVLDEPVEDGGKNQNANPMQFFIASLVACENEQAAVVAGELKINISKIEWTVDVELDLAGFTGDNTELGQPYTSASISAKVTTDGTAKQVAALGKSIAARCPITQLLVNSGVKVSHTFETSSGTMPGTLYTLAPSANSFGLVALIKHLNFDVTIKPLDMTKGETRTPEFLALNPNHTCPTLEYAPGKAIVESNAILRYVANAAKAEHVYPSDPLLKAHVDSALDWQLCSAKFIGAVAYPHLGFGGTVESATAGHAALTENLELFQKSFFAGEHAKDKFIGGDKPSIADFKFAAYFRFIDADKTFKRPQFITDYETAFAAAVPEFKDAAAGYDGYLKSLQK